MLLPIHRPRKKIHSRVLGRAMHPILNTRRHFFRECGIGIGSMALASLLGRQGRTAAPARPIRSPAPPHFPPKAKSVIYLFMAGGPSQLELFDHKPKLQKLDGQPIPESFVAGQAASPSWTRSPRRRQAAGHAAQVRAARPVAARGSRKCCRTSRSIVDDIAVRARHEDRRLQPRPGESSS